MHSQRLAPCPSLPHDRRLANVHHLLDDIQLAQAVVALALGFQRGKLRLVLPAYVLDVAQPVVNQPQPIVAQRGEHPAAAVVPAHDDVTYAKDVHGKLNGREAVEVRVDHHVGDVAVDEHLPGQQAHDLVGRYPAVGAPDPEVLRRLLTGQPPEEVGVLPGHLGCPHAVVRKQVAEDSHLVVLRPIRRTTQPTRTEHGRHRGPIRQAVLLALDRQGYGRPPKRPGRKVRVDDPDRVKLLFGPYTAPPLRRGDRATCLFRDCLVVVTAWTDAPIPWPRCRTLDGPGGGSGLLVDEELARAVRHESAAAVMRWWGASHNAVQNWRRALGVGRTNNEGTHRLIQGSAEKGAEAVKAREWTEEEREQRRLLNAEKGLADNLILGYHGPLWTPEDIALLGTLPDEEVARRTGRTVNAVRLKREELGIPNPAGNRWRPEDITLLGTLPDREVARRLGRPLHSVTQKRCKLGIPTFEDRRRRDTR